MQKTEAAIKSLPGGIHILRDFKQREKTFKGKIAIER
jgi:hypothetical protein